jgi:predicted ribosome quality control (RQC) complex YloA/Tae2 family protein
MDDTSIKLIVDEIEPLIVGRSPGKIFQLGEASMAIDFGLRGEGYLLLSVEPATPRIYLIKRRVRDLEKQSRPLSPFALNLRKELANTRLKSVHKQADDRIVWFTFAGEDDLGAPKTRNVEARLTGRSANLLLLDHQDNIINTLRSSATREGSDSRRESVARSTSSKPLDLLNLIRGGEFATASAAADQYFTSLAIARAASARIATARGDLRKKISRQEKLLRQLENDRREHQDFESHKRIGDLLLANLNTAKRNDGRVELIDYFADHAPTIEVEIEESASLQEEAARRFRLFSRSKRALEQINRRMNEVQASLAELAEEQSDLEKRIAAGEFSSDAIEPSTPGSTNQAAKKEQKRVPGARRYVSSDGFDILVGRTAKDNDHLTFKVAQPNDVWLHAADYGGSHVVVRNSTRKEIPHRTLVEAAELAAYFSQAKKNPRADVHYTERKFVSKIKGAKPGLVRLQRFKNITVTPKEAATRV